MGVNHGMSQKPLNQPSPKIDLLSFFSGAEDYVILRIPDIFPDYRDYSDVDVLCKNTVAFLKRILAIGAPYEQMGFRICIQALGRRLHVDFYAPGAERLNIRFDLIDTLECYDQFGVCPQFAADILKRKCKRVLRETVVYVPELDDELAVRFLEYLKYKNEHPSKVKHLAFIRSADRLEFLKRIERYTDLSVSVSSNAEQPDFSVTRKAAASAENPERAEKESENRRNRRSPTCRIPHLAGYCEQVFSRRSNGCFIVVGESRGENDSMTSVPAAMEWRGHYIRPMPQHIHHSSLNDHLADKKVEPGFELLIIDVASSERGFLENFSISRWQPEMVIIRLPDARCGCTSLERKRQKITKRFEDHGYIPIYQDASWMICVSKTKLAGPLERMDYFIVWGHGLSYAEEILDRIRRRTDFEIVAIHKRPIADIRRFTEALYECDTVPIEHLQNKTRYLLKTPAEIIFILVRNKNPQERMYGEGAFRHIQCALIKDLKEEVRNAFNPRHNGKRTEDHVIHGSDYESQVEHTLKLLQLPPISRYQRQPHPGFVLPYHLEPFETCSELELPLSCIKGNVLGKGVVPLEETPHYYYVQGNIASYISYYRKHLGDRLTDDHSPAAFENLIRTFDPILASRKDNPSPIVVARLGNDYVIQDGLHRAVLLKRHGESTVRVLEIVPKKQSMTIQLPLSVIIFSKDRPLQLDATLRSFYLQCADADSTSINVIYTSSSPFFRRLYDQLKDDFPKVEFIYERNFKSDLINLIIRSEHVLFCVDDCLFVRRFMLDEILNNLAQHDHSIGFSLRLGRNTTYCYPFNRAQKLPEFTKLNAFVISYDWTSAELDFAYPLELSSSVYRSSDLLPWLDKLEFYCPNSLESRLAENAHRFANHRPSLLCYLRSVAFCAPLNKVQTEYPNRSSENADTTVESLARLYQQGRRINVEIFDGFTPNGCHQEILPKLVQSKPGDLSLSRDTLFTKKKPIKKHRLKAQKPSLVKVRQWRESVLEEISFWDDYLRNRGSHYHKVDFGFRLDPESRLQEIIIGNLSLKETKQAKILDVGSGPLTSLGKKWPGHEVDLTVVDPLADQYNELIRKYGLIPPVPTKTAVAEELSDHFPLNNFDIVYARNSIDNSIDAPLAVEQMLAVTKPGGSVLMEHGIREGKATEYNGLHQWNFSEQDGEFIIESARGAITNISRCLAGIADVQCSIDQNRNWISICIKKLVPTVIEDEMPLVSVVIPCFKQAGFLPDAVNSVLKQTYDNYEIIIVNDGSPDDTSAVVQRLIDENPGKKIRLEEKTNSGLANTRNHGIRLASGSYVLPLDADDMIHPEMIAKCVSLLESNKAISIAYTDVVYFGEVATRVDAGNFDLQRLKYANQLSYCSLFRKNAWEIAGGYNPNMVHGYEDWDFWIACGKTGIRARRIAEPLFIYRVKKDSMFTKATQHDLELKAQIVLNHRILYSTEEIENAQRVLGTAGENSVSVECEKTGLVHCHPTGISERNCGSNSAFAVSKDENSLIKTILSPRKLVSEEPKVSVIVPTYQRPELLRRTLRSLVNQTFESFEVLVVDDGGIDISDIVELFETHLCIKHIRHNINQGLSAARNSGIKASKGKYLVYLDDDDTYYPNHIETLVQFLEATNYKVAYTDAYRAWEVPFDGGYIVTKKDVPYSYDFDYQSILKGNFIPVLCVMHDKECIDTAGYFDETLKSHEDWDLWMRMSRVYAFAHLKKVTCEFSWRQDGTTMTLRNKADMDSTYQIVAKRGEHYRSQGCYKRVLRMNDTANRVIHT